MALTPLLSSTSGRAAVYRDVVGTKSYVPRADTPTVLRWKERAAAADRTIATKTLPFWYDRSYKGSLNGYRLGEDAARGRFEEDGQLIVSQARLVWAFARAHRMGYSDGDRDYLLAARHGFEHLQNAFRDAEHGGYFWRVRDGKGGIDTRKVLYGQSFVLYAFVECAAAAQDAAVFASAIDLYNTLECPGPARGPPLSVAEIAARDFSLLEADKFATDRLDGVCWPHYRCSNTVLHWMEALTDLARDRPADADIRHSLEQALVLNATKFYPADLDAGIDYVPADAKAPPWPQPKLVSYGHNVEFAWLMIAAQQVLGVEPDWPRVESTIDHALKWGFDTKHGGLFGGGWPGKPAHDCVKNWWPQAEMIAALTYLIASGRASRSFDADLKLMLDWYEGPQMDAATGTPYSKVAEDGSQVDTTLSGQWQAAYHDLRARWIFIESMGVR
jgi:mannose/cellobiose epimerase-like protein (N-acyl-D-glucosamine 2-epimerase family)